MLSASSMLELTNFGTFYFNLLMAEFNTAQCTVLLYLMW